MILVIQKAVIIVAAFLLITSLSSAEIPRCYFFEEWAYDSLYDTSEVFVGIDTSLYIGFVEIYDSTQGPECAEFYYERDSVIHHWLACPEVFELVSGMYVAEEALYDTTGREIGTASLIWLFPTALFDTNQDGAVDGMDIKRLFEKVYKE